MNKNNKGLMERLAAGTVLGDGGYLLELEKRGWVRAGPFTPEVVLEHPEAVRELHLEFRAAGAEVLQALTFYASREKLATVGLDGRLDELNRQAVRLAREVAGNDALVAGNLALTWLYDMKDPKSHDAVRAQFDEQLAGQVGEGVDFMIGETFSFLGEALLATERAKKSGLPVMITMCFENEDVTPEGHTPADCAKRLVDAGADVVGINCLRNPEHTLPLMKQMRAAVSTPLACQPVGYRTAPGKPDFTSQPEFPTQLDPLQLSRGEMAQFAVDARDMGIEYIGGCCGVVATHIREMARRLGKLAEDQRPWRVNYDRPTSATEYYGHRIEEKGQAKGSKRA
jgi:betaine-homocysteine S-methyltransferase